MWTNEAFLTYKCYEKCIKQLCQYKKSLFSKTLGWLKHELNVSEVKTFKKLAQHLKFNQDFCLYQYEHCCWLHVHEWCIFFRSFGFHGKVDLQYLWYFYFDLLTVQCYTICENWNIARQNWQWGLLSRLDQTYVKPYMN